MPTQSKGRSKKSSRTTKKGARTATKKKRTLVKVTETEDLARERFIRDLLIRGEAAKPTADGDLPPGATHKIVEEREGELPEVERDRFNIY